MFFKPEVTGSDIPYCSIRYYYLSYARSIYQDPYLEEEYRGSYDSIKRYIRKLKGSQPKLYARIETPPGEEAQVDFGQGAPTLKNGKYRRLNLFVMTLSNSRQSYEEVVWSQDVETFIPRSTFYSWYKKHLDHGYDGLADKTSGPRQFWNKIPEIEREKIRDIALEYPEKTPRASKRHNHFLLHHLID